MILKEDEYEELWEWCRAYIDDKCIWRANKKLPCIPGKIKGTWYTWQFYLRNGLFNADFASGISQLMLHKIGKEYGSYNFQIAGMETASTPLLASIPLVAKVYGIDINSFSIRKNQKEYGLRNHIEGLVNEKPVLLIDDLANSTMSLRKSFDILVHIGCQKILDKPFVVVNKVKSSDSSHLAHKDKYLPEQMGVIGLYTLDNFNLNTAQKNSI